MAKLRATESFGLGGSKTTESVFSKNHFSSKNMLSPEVKQKIASMGLERVAGNAWACPSDRSFWKVEGNKVIKLVSDEVDEGEKLQAAPSNNPMNFLSTLMDDLSFD